MRITTPIFELLNSLAQPTDYERARQKPEAVHLARNWLVACVAARLADEPLPGGNEAVHDRINLLKKKYRITDEELYGSPAE